MPAARHGEPGGCPARWGPGSERCSAKPPDRHPCDCRQTTPSNPLAVTICLCQVRGLAGVAPGRNKTSPRPTEPPAVKRRHHACRPLTGVHGRPMCVLRGVPGRSATLRPGRLMWTHARPPPPARPGPVNIHDRVLRAMNVPGQNHRDPWFAEIFKKVLADTKYIFRTEKGTPFIFPGAARTSREPCFYRGGSHTQPTSRQPSCPGSTPPRHDLGAGTRQAPPDRSRAACVPCAAQHALLCPLARRQPTTPPSSHILSPPARPCSARPAPCRAHRVLTGTGTGGWESALTNTLSPGDKVVTFRCAGLPPPPLAHQGAPAAAVHSQDGRRVGCTCSHAWWLASWAAPCRQSQHVLLSNTATAPCMRPQVRAV
jgi:hypothetical protein